MPDRPSGRRSGRNQPEGRQSEGRQAPKRQPAKRQPARRPAGGAARGRPPGEETGPAAAAPGEDAATAARQEASALALLTEGSLEVEGRLMVASNATLYCTIKHGGTVAACVYKPVAGERPLWDFPTGSLAGREVAAYEVSRVSGFGVVPPTVYREGPFGPGMCQLWIDADQTVDVLGLARRTDHAGLRAMAVFDAVINNADRKAGHLLPAPGGHLYGCDHGVCFGEEYKLRTVLWQWRGRSLPGRSVAALRRLQECFDDGDLGENLAAWLTDDEVKATRDRLELLLKHRVHPYPPEDWPAVPWPPV
jgi:uncharacterized repeat protein (TIGR03843 family)